jgi:hypothetical protein
MIRTLRISDLLRLPAGLPGGEDLACGAPGTQPVRLSALRIARWVGAPRGRTEPVTATNGARLDALAVLSVRSGPSAWSVQHLFSTPAAHTHLPALLAVGVARAAAHRAERLFLRAPEGGPVREQAVQAGFAPCWQERRLTTPRALAPVGSASLSLRPETPADALGLFRLNAACVPAPARASTGLTLEQWQDAQEPAAPGARAYVWERAGEVRGWVRLAHRGDRLVVEALAHPAEGADALAALTDDVALLARGHRQALWAVPDHQRALEAVLARRGWSEDSRCMVLAATTGIRVPLVGTVAAGA